jgi:hypothetical protein
MFSRPSKIGSIAPVVLPRFDTSGMTIAVTAGKIGIYEVLGYIRVSGINKKEKILITASDDLPAITYQVTSSSTSPFTKWNGEVSALNANPVSLTINNGQYLHIAMEAEPGGDDGVLDIMSPDINGKTLFSVSYTF